MSQASTDGRAKLGDMPWFGASLQYRSIDGEQFLVVMLVEANDFVDVFEEAERLAPDVISKDARDLTFEEIIKVSEADPPGRFAEVSQWWQTAAEGWR